MYSQVDAIVFNAILEGVKVSLPGVGSISTVRHPASFRSSSEIIPPHHTFAFSGSQDGVSLVGMIASVAQIDEQRALDTYMEWLEHARDKGDVIRIGGVGRIEGKTFTPTIELKRALDPTFQTLVHVHPKGSLWLRVTLFIVLAAAGLAVAFLPDIRQFAEEMLSTYGSVADTREPLRDAGAGMDNVIPCVDTCRVEESVDVPDTLAMAPSEDAVVQHSYDAAAPEVGELVAGRSYLVLGVFREKANASVETERIRGIAPQVTVLAYRFGDKTMLSVFESESLEECSAKARELKETNAAFDDVWIYTR